MRRDDFVRITTYDMQEFEVNLIPRTQTSILYDAKGRPMTRERLTEYWEYTVRRRVDLGATTGCGNGSSGKADTKEEALAAACEVALRVAMEAESA